MGLYGFAAAPDLVPSLIEAVEVITRRQTRLFPNGAAPGASGLGGASTWCLKRARIATYQVTAGVDALVEKGLRGRVIWPGLEDDRSACALNMARVMVEDSGRRRDCRS